MEYVQMTLNEWVQIKRQIADDLLMATRSFVRIGYNLRRIEEEKLYLQDGFSTIAEFAKSEYGLEASTVSRFIAINKRFSIDGNSDQLRPEYACIKSSVLSEMLALPEGDMQMVTGSTQRESVRELKKFNKDEPAAGASDIDQLIMEFFRNNQELLKDLHDLHDFPDADEEKMAGLIAPSGARTYRKGFYFVAFQENGIKVKRYGDLPQTMTYTEFAYKVDDIFGEDWQACFAEKMQQEEEPRCENAADRGGKAIDEGKKEDPEKGAEEDKKIHSAASEGSGRSEQPAAGAERTAEPDRSDGKTADGTVCTERKTQEDDIRTGREEQAPGEESAAHGNSSEIKGKKVIAPAQILAETGQQEPEKPADEIQTKLFLAIDQLRDLVSSRAWEDAELKLQVIKAHLKNAEIMTEEEDGQEGTESSAESAADPE